MFDALGLIVVGIVIGWHVPQPAWAVTAIDFVLKYAKPLLKPLLEKVVAVKAMVVGDKKKKKK